MIIVHMEEIELTDESGKVIGKEERMAITRVAPAFIAKHKTKQEAAESLAKKVVPKGSKFLIVQDEVIENLDKDYRNAWRINNNSPEIDMKKARKIHVDKIRTERNKLWPEADADFAKAQDEAKPLNARKASKHRKDLRDAPDSVAEEVESAGTVEELKKVWPKAMKRTR